MSETPLLPTLDSVRRMRQQRRRFNCRNVSRLVLPASVVAAFLLFIFTASIVDKTGHRLPWKNQPDVVFPNFSHYISLQTLPHTHFPIHPDDDKRIVAIGDIHAMNQSLSTLLTKISYDPQSDTLIHLGDLVSKSKKLSSEPVLSFMSANHILGVRGNNDQKVIEWRAWRDWIVSLPRGREWLEDIDSIWSHIDGDKPSDEFNTWFKKSHKEWQSYVPNGWKLQGKHYKVAHDMSQDHYDYLRSLPLVLYAPTAHTYFVHAGLLPADPTREYSDPKQPLSHLPATANPEDDELTLRRLQELALLNEIPQNQDPWVLMNMRSLSKDGAVNDSKKGTPWSDLWNDVIGSCSLPATELPTNLSMHGSTTRTSINCFPSMVLYGHAAVRDLDVKRWSVGIDTGCAYGRRLTAVILDTKSLLPRTHSITFDASLQDSLIPYGDDGTAQIISVKCHA
ncbi:Metallo-dependent phosphatase [Imleria badia]|nr:Metallo-dependent phosphatase [Imleria badia]